MFVFVFRLGFVGCRIDDLCGIEVRRRFRWRLDGLYWALLGLGKIKGSWGKMIRIGGLASGGASITVGGALTIIIGFLALTQAIVYGYVILSVISSWPMMIRWISIVAMPISTFLCP